MKKRIINKRKILIGVMILTSSTQVVHSAPFEGRVEKNNSTQAATKNPKNELSSAAKKRLATKEQAIEQTGKKEQAIEQTGKEGLKKNFDVKEFMKLNDAAAKQKDLGTLKLPIKQTGESGPSQETIIFDTITPKQEGLELSEQTVAGQMSQSRQPISGFEAGQSDNSFAQNYKATGESSNQTSLVTSQPLQKRSYSQAASDMSRNLFKSNKRTTTTNAESGAIERTYTDKTGKVSSTKIIEKDGSYKVKDAQGRVIEEGNGQNSIVKNIEYDTNGTKQSATVWENGQVKGERKYEKDGISYKQNNIDGTIETKTNSTLKIENKAKNKTREETIDTETGVKTTLKQKPNTLTNRLFTGNKEKQVSSLKKSIPLTKNGKTVKVGVKVDPTTKSTTITTPEGQKITYQPDGSYLIEGKNSVLKLTIDSNGQPKAETYNKGDWSTQEISSDQALASQGLQKGFLWGTYKANKPKAEYLDDGSVKITTTTYKRGQSEPMVISEIVIDPTGNITSKRLVDGKLQEISKTSLDNASGKIKIEQFQKDGGTVERILSQEGDIILRQQLKDGSIKERYNNGPEITTTELADGKSKSVFQKKDKTEIIVRQDNFSLTVDRPQEGKGLLGTGLFKSKAQSVVLNFESYIKSPNLFESLTTKNLKSARSEQSQSKIIDDMTVRLTGEKNILDTPEYKAFKDKIIQELNSKGTPSRVQWLTNFFKRIFSLDTVSQTKKAIEEKVTQENRDRVTQAEVEKNYAKDAESTQGVAAEEKTAQNMKVSFSKQGNDIITSRTNTANGITTSFSQNSNTVVNSKSTGDQVAALQGENFVFQNGKTTLILNARTGEITKGSQAMKIPQPSTDKQIVSVDPKTGDKTIITVDEYSRPRSKIIIKPDNSVEFYGANNQGVIAEKPTSTMKINQDGSISTQATVEQLSLLPGSKPKPISKTIKLDTNGEILQALSHLSFALGALV